MKLGLRLAKAKKRLTLWFFINNFREDQNASKLLQEFEELEREAEEEDEDEGEEVAAKLAAHPLASVSLQLSLDAVRINLKETDEGTVAAQNGGGGNALRTSSGSRVGVRHASESSATLERSASTKSKKKRGSNAAEKAVAAAVTPEREKEHRLLMSGISCSLKSEKNETDDVKQVKRVKLKVFKSHLI